MNVKIKDIVEKVISLMETEGEIIWRKPWKSSGGFRKHSDCEEYSIRNSLILMAQGEKPGSEFIGYKAALNEGGYVKKNEKGKYIFKKGLCKSKKKVDDEGNPVLVPFVKMLWVFNVDTQCEGIERKCKVETYEHERIEEAEAVAKAYFERTNTKFTQVPNDAAYFRPSEKLVQVPPIEMFENVAEYYSALFHEIVHSTGIKEFLDRHDEDTKFAPFGSEDYSKEELVAEIGGLYCLSEFGIEDKCQFRNSTAYLQGWMKKIKNEPDVFMWAAGKAEQAVDFIFNRKKEYNDGTEKED